MVDAVALDTIWLKHHPLPTHEDGVDKNCRGHVLVIGGSRGVPGGVLLTADAAFRAGAGKVTIATIASAVIPLGIAAPDCALIALAETESGEIAPENTPLILANIAKYDALVFGPAITDVEIASILLGQLLSSLPADIFLLLDAFALRAASDHQRNIAARKGRIILTPNESELAAMLNLDTKEVKEDPLAALTFAAQNYAATVMIKGSTTQLIADGVRLSYSGGGLGLAVSGSGDVLAGLIASLGAQGLAPLEAAAWGVWLHGEAGRRLAETVGPIGYRALELAPLVPSLMRGV